MSETELLCFLVEDVQSVKAMCRNRPKAEVGWVSMIGTKALHGALADMYVEY